MSFFFGVSYALASELVQRMECQHGEEIRFESITNWWAILGLNQ